MLWAAAAHTVSHIHLDHQYCNVQQRMTITQAGMMCWLAGKNAANLHCNQQRRLLVLHRHMHGLAGDLPAAELLPTLWSAQSCPEHICVVSTHMWCDYLYASYSLSGHAVHVRFLAMWQLTEQTL